MLKLWKTIVRIVQSYSIEEKVISLLLALVITGISIQGVINIFSTPEIFAGKGGFYTEGIVSEPPILINPVYAELNQANRDLSSLVFSGLTKYDPQKQAFVEDIGELTIGEDNRTYTFKIRDDVFFHDGEKLTVDDVYFTYHDVIQDPALQNPILKANFEGVEIKKNDDQTVSFVLKRKNSFFITNLNVGILPEHLLKDVSVTDLPSSAFNQKPVGTGPYKIEQPFEMTGEGEGTVYLAQNELYYKDKAKIMNIRINTYPNSQSILKDQSKFNMIAKVPGDIMGEVLSQKRFEGIYYELPQYTAVFMNIDSNILKDQKVRLALQKAVNKEELINSLSDKVAVDTPLMSLNQEEWILQFNKEEAEGALFDAGYKYDEEENDGYRKNSDGENLRLRLLARNLSENPVAAEDVRKTVDFLVNAWKQIGVEVIPEYEPRNIFIERLNNRDFDLLLTGESLGYNLDTYPYWHSSQVGENGYNLSNYKSFKADALIENVRSTFDNEEKTEYLNELANTIANEVPAIFLYRPNYLMVKDSKVKNVDMNNLAYPSDRYANITNWCIDCNK
ncbi:hypothetical protein GF340_00335 [Candidatus Peregrinibacteria bacterium]|nr:hypothetical protein [Candidatus Peregrinibacteria bacterium]